MIYYLVVGVIMALGGATIPEALLTVPVLAGLKAIHEVVVQRSWITGVESNYVIYKGILAQQGALPANPWVRFVVSAVLTGAVLGMAAYFLLRLFM